MSGSYVKTKEMNPSSMNDTMKMLQFRYKNVFGYHEIKGKTEDTGGRHRS